MILDPRLTRRQYRKADLSSCLPEHHHARATAHHPFIGGVTRKYADLYRAKTRRRGIVLLATSSTSKS